MISRGLMKAAALLFVSLLGVGVVPAVDSGQKTGAFPIVTERPGWPVLTLGDTFFSPPILLRADGTRFLLHNRLGVMGKRPGAPARTLAGRDPEGVILPGWTPLIQGIPIDGVSVWLDGGRHVRRVFGGGGRIHGFNADGTRASGWPQPKGLLPFLEPPSLMDMDGDGTPEVLAATRDGDLFIWRQDGSLFPGWPQKVPPLQTQESLSIPCRRRVPISMAMAFLSWW
ncbi:MAG: hypothetical protein ACE5ID_06465 [Acidobacteriota bacterium]